MKLNAQTDPDVLTFTNGERLIGRLKSATGSSLIFKSDNAGEVTVPWKNVQELRTSQKFAAIPKDAKLRRSEDANTVPQGTVVITGQTVQIATGAQPAPSVPIANLSNLVEETAFQSAFRRSSFYQGWRGGATAGLSITQATQTSRTFTAAVNLVRAVPAGSWLGVRSRTIFDYNEAYSRLSQPATPDVKTSLYHVDAEQDWYLRPRLFAFGAAALDHNFSQGLDLQQTYGGGLGVVVVKRDNQELDFKASLNYIDQRFATSRLNKHLFGSNFGETYIRRFAHAILLTEQAGITPAWNDTSAYSAFVSAGLTLPVYHRFGVTLGAVDNFLNDPPPGFRKNSFQFTLGATYSFQ